MERLSIDEIIAHCERTVERTEKLNEVEALEVAYIEIPPVKEYWEHRQVAEYLKELKAYRDAEKQGLLVKIDCRCRGCKHVDFAGCKNKTCYCLKNECYMQEDDFCKYAERYKEEAGQKLTEMKGDNND